LVRWLCLIFRFLLDPPSLCKFSSFPSKSLSNLVLSYSMWIDWCRNEKNGRCLDTCSFKDKTAAKIEISCGKTKGHKEIKTTRGSNGLHGRGSHMACFASSLHCVLVLCSGPQVLPLLGHVRPLLLSFLIL